MSRLSLGCVTFGREIDERTSSQIMETAVTNGINLFDTASAYGSGRSEEIVGRWLSSNGCRDQILLQTKAKPPFTSKALRESFVKSLDRLQTDRIDVYLLHEYDPDTDLEETLMVLTELADSQQVRAFGCSNFSLADLQRASSISADRGLRSFSVIQPVYNLLAREIESATTYCAEHAIDIVSYSPLAAGFLTGKYSEAADTVPRGSRFDVAPGHKGLYFTPRNFSILAHLRNIATASGLSMSELALLWVLQNPSLMSVLVGATSVNHVTNAINTLDRIADPQLSSLVRNLNPDVTTALSW